MTLDFDISMRHESAAFRAAIEATDSAAVVPTCPDWNADDLLWHLGEVQHFWAAIVGERLPDPSAYEQPDRPSGRAALLEFFDDAHAALVAALASAADSDTAWSWFAADQTVGFTRRRQAHEALIHRIDAEIAAGLDSTIDADLAADGILEVLEVMFGGAPAWGVISPGGPIGEIRCSDLDHRWLVQVQTFSGTSPNTGTSYTDEPIVALIDAGEPSFSVEGAAADLDRWLWNRHPQGPIAEHGDTSAFIELVLEGIE